MTFNLFSKKREAAIALLLLLFPLSYAATHEININLQYLNGTQWDENNDGIESLKGVIDFTVKGTDFNWDVDYKNLCTKWAATNLETYESSSICNGNEKCCNFVNLQPRASNWDDGYYLYYGFEGAGVNNIVSSQVMYIDYNLSIASPYSDIVYSYWAELPAYFITTSTKYSLSSIISQNGIQLNIKSPENSTILSGENVYLNFTSNSTILANFSLDNQPAIYLGNTTSFSILLNGSLPYGIIGNGVHSIVIFTQDSSANIEVLNYNFTVNDSSGPVIIINITNGSSFYGTEYNQKFRIASDEYADINLRLNNAPPYYLGTIKTANINLTLQSGQNILEINSTDIHGNSKIDRYTFNFSVPSCSDGIKNGDESGVDCGGVCSALCLPFNVTTDKYIYNSSESVWATVISRSYSYVDLSVFLRNNLTYKYIFTPLISGAPIYWQSVIGNTQTAGNYTINATMHYINTSETKIINFTVNSPVSSNPLSVSISANATTINEGETVLFSSSVSGSLGTLSYQWDFQGDGIIDSTSPSASYTYTQNNIYFVNLTVKDSQWNKTASSTISVRKLHNITITVKDNSTLAFLENAEVEIFDQEKNTTSDGKSVFTLVYGNYDLQIKKQGYLLYRKDLDIYNDSIDIMMVETDDSPPSITLSSPGNSTLLKESSVILRYATFDKSDMTCKVYLKSGYDWAIKNISYGLKSGTEQSFSLYDLGNLTYWWKVLCIDSSGNSNTSEGYTFSVNTSQPDELSVELSQQNNDTEYLIGQIDSIASSFAQLGSKEKDAVESLMILKSLESSKTELKRANRDLNNLKWRRLNETALKEETNLLITRIEGIKNSTPKSISVLGESEFVDYPPKSSVENVSLAFINSNNLKFSKKQKQEFIDRNQKLQSLVTITTKLKILEIEYLSGKKNTVTLVDKSIKTSENNLSDSVLYEIIPKEIASDISEAVLLFEYKIIEKDPVIEIDFQKINHFAYYFNKKIDIKAMEAIQSVILTKDTNIKEKNAITGFSILRTLKPALISTSDTRLVVEVVIVIVLILIYFAYSFSLFEKLKALFSRGQSKEIKDIENKITKSSAYIDEDLYSKAKSVYDEINTQFKELPKESKSKVYSRVVELGYKIDAKYLNNLLDESFSCLESSQHEKAASIYAKVSGLYKKLSSEYKSGVIKRCMELNERLNSVRI